jgi:isoamylase
VVNTGADASDESVPKPLSAGTSVTVEARSVVVLQAETD